MCYLNRAQSSFFKVVTAQDEVKEVGRTRWRGLGVTDQTDFLTLEE